MDGTTLQGDIVRDLLTVMNLKRRQCRFSHSDLSALDLDLVAVEDNNTGRSLDIEIDLDTAIVAPWRLDT